jgi:circadian clock protein KaiC
MPAGEAGRIGPEQLPTGVPGLDRLLNGGLRRGGLHVVLGGPGAGKSVLAHQVGAHQIRAGGKVLYLTALVETHQMLLSQARTFRFFDPAFVPGSFYYASLYPALAAGGLQGAREEIGRLVAHHAPTLLVVDGVHALKAAAESPMDYQRFMHDMEAQAAVAGTTTLMLVHPPETGIATDPTFTIADAILHMRSRMVRLRDVRMFSVGKLRGVAHVGGWHTFRITGDGVHVYPRVEALASAMEAHVDGVSGSPRAGSDRLLDVRIKDLDEMLGGGLDRNSVTLVVGTPGGGKTLFGLAFLAAGAEAGEPGLLLGYHERPETLADKGEGVGLPVRRGIDEGMIHLDWRAPAELLADEEIERLLALVEKHRIRRVVIDALEDVRQAVIPRSRELVVLASLANLLREKQVTTVVMHDLQRIVGVSFDMPMAELSALMDNVIHVRAVEQKGEMSRLVAVLKVRARMHDHGLREFHITPMGMSVGKAFSGSEMVLTGLGLPR